MKKGPKRPSGVPGKLYYLDFGSWHSAKPAFYDKPGKEYACDLHNRAIVMFLEEDNLGQKKVLAGDQAVWIWAFLDECNSEEYD